MRRLRKYATIISVFWQDALQYRGNALGWTFFAVLPPLTMMMLWVRAYRGDQTEVAGFSLQQMITYYLGMTLLNITITPHQEWDISRTIQSGQLSHHLVRPIDYFWLRSMMETAWQVMKSLLFLPGFVFIVWLFRHYVEVPALPWTMWAAFVCSSTLTYLLFLEIKFLLGISAFWVGSAGGFIEIWYMLMMVFSGELVPLALFPDWFQRLGEFLPFRYLYYFPLMVLLNKVEGVSVLHGLLTQAAWVFSLYAVVRFTWRKGLLAYEGFGG